MMIVTCEKCSRSFNIQDNLIPNEGRFLQCGSCGHKWFYKISKSTANDKNNEIFNSIPFEKSDFEVSKIKDKKNELFEEKIVKNESYESKNKITFSKKRPNIIKYTFVVIISLIALIILTDTFKNQLNNYIPGINLLLNNLYETLKDLTLFFQDLIN